MPHLDLKTEVLNYTSKASYITYIVLASNVPESKAHVLVLQGLQIISWYKAKYFTH